jgi:hypothetical protein
LYSAMGQVAEGLIIAVSLRQFAVAKVVNTASISKKYPGNTRFP